MFAGGQGPLGPPSSSRTRGRGSRGRAPNPHPRGPTGRDGFLHRARSRPATSVCQLRHDRMEQDPTEPHAGRSTFLLSSGGVGGGGGRVLLRGLWYGADRY